MATRDLTEAFKAAMAGSPAKGALFIEMVIGRIYYRFWTGKRNISWDGKTWLASSFILRVGDSEETQNDRSTGIEISFNANSQTMVALALNGILQNEECKVWFAMVKDAALENLVTYSEQLEQWSVERADRDDAQIQNPIDCALTASFIWETATTGTHNVWQTFTAASGSTYRLTVYAKPLTRTRLRLVANNTNNASVYFNLASCEISSQAYVTDAKIEAVGAGWYRCMIEWASTLSGSRWFGIYLVNDAGASNYAGTLGYGLHVYAPHLRLASSSDVYIKTTAAIIEATGKGDAIISDPYLAFDGFLDTCKIDHSSSGSVVTFRYSSDLNILSKASGQRYTTATQEQYYIGDKGFDFCPQIESWSGYWGLPK